MADMMGSSSQRSRRVKMACQELILPDKPLVLVHKDFFPSKNSSKAQSDIGAHSQILGHHPSKVTVFSEKTVASTQYSDDNVSRDRSQYRNQGKANLRFVNTNQVFPRHQKRPSLVSRDWSASRKRSEGMQRTTGNLERVSRPSVNSIKKQEKAPEWKNEEFFSSPEMPAHVRGTSFACYGTSMPIEQTDQTHFFLHYCKFD